MLLEDIKKAKQLRISNKDQFNLQPKKLAHDMLRLVYQNMTVPIHHWSIYLTSEWTQTVETLNISQKRAYFLCFKIHLEFKNKEHENVHNINTLNRYKYVNKKTVIGDVRTCIYLLNCPIVN